MTLARTKLISAASSRRDSIVAFLETMADAQEQIVELVTAAKDNDDHLLLGYPSWPAYVATEYGGLLASLDRDDRRLAVLALSETGMSSRAIAPLVGVSHETVAQDVRSGVRNLTPAEDRSVTGIDGKSYGRSPRRPPRRSSLPDSAWKAFYELQKAVDRVDRIVNDDRFTQNRETIHDAHASDLARMHKTLFQARSKINGQTPADEVTR